MGPADDRGRPSPTGRTRRIIVKKIKTAESIVGSVEAGLRWATATAALLLASVLVLPSPAGAATAASAPAAKAEKADKAAYQSKAGGRNRVSAL